MISYLYNIWRSLTQHIGSTCKKSNNITQNIGVCCTLRKYTQFLPYTTVYFAVYEFTLHNFWFHSENQHVHLLLFPCTPSFVPYSIWLTVRVTVDTSSTIHAVPSYHIRTLAMCVIFLGLNNLFKLDFVSSCRLLNYCRGIFSRSDMKNCGFCQQLEREADWKKFTFSHSLCICCDATRF